MYKYEISADSPEDLERKIEELVTERLTQRGKKQSVKPQYVDQGETETPPIPASTPQIPTVREGLDSKHIPYDSRIHSSTKAFNTNGTWRYRRGVEQSVIDQVEAELKAGTKVQATIAVVPPPPPPLVNQAPLAVPQFAEHVPAPAAPAAVKSVPAQQAPSLAHLKNYAVPEAVAFPSSEPAPVQEKRPVHNLQTFTANFHMIVAHLIVAGKINQQYLQALKMHFIKQADKDGISVNLPEIWNLVNYPNYIAQLFNEFAQLGYITAVDG